jgi:ABC-type multidrug transport system fused ATPase/permease subunit
MQLISGMSKAAYWMSNMLADIIKLYIPIFVILLSNLVF